MRRLIKADFRAAAAAGLKCGAIIAVFFGVIIFTPLLGWLGYHDETRARAMAIALELIVVMTVLGAGSELVQRWLKPS